MHAYERRRPTVYRRALSAVVLTVAVVAASGCGFSRVLDKRDVAARIAHSYDLARGAGVASGKLELTLTVLKLHLPVAIPGLKEGFTTKPVSAPMTIDVGRARWASVVDAGKGPQVVRAFDDAVLYEYNADAGQARPYTAVNIGRLYDSRQQHKGDAAGNNILNPTYMFELLPGVLTGSIKTLGPETVGDVATTHFTANFDATRALAHATKDRQHAIAAALDLMNVDNSAIKGEVWLDAAGQPRKVLMHLREKVERRIIVGVNVTAEIDHSGGDAVPIPPRELAVGTSDIGVVAPRITKLIGRLSGGAAGGAGGGVGA